MQWVMDTLGLYTNANLVWAMVIASTLGSFLGRAAWTIATGRNDS